MAALVRSEVVPCAVFHFRALMERLSILYPEGWMASNGERLVFGAMWDLETPSYRATWRVCLESLPLLGVLRSYEEDAPLRHGGMEVYALPSGHSRIDFLDGYMPRSDGRPLIPIGSAFEEFCQMVLSEAQAMASQEAAFAMADGGKEIRLDVHMEASQLLDRLVVFVEEQEGQPGCFRTGHIGGTYILDTGERLWTHRTEQDGCCCLCLDTLSYEWEDMQAEGSLPAFRGKRRVETKAMSIDLRPWGEAHTHLIARWWQPQGETWVKRLLSEVATYRPEVRFRLLEPGTLVKNGKVLPLTWDAWQTALSTFDGHISSENPAWFEALWAAQMQRNRTLADAQGAISQLEAGTGIEGEVKGPEPQKPPKPKKPASKAGLQAWFDYHHEMERAGYKSSLRQIAEETNFSYGHIRNEHTDYLAEHPELQK